MVLHRQRRHVFSPSEPSAFAVDRGLTRFIALSGMDAISVTARNNVSVYVIDPEGLQASPGDWSESFANETGGYAWGRTNNFGAAIDQIYRESASFYLLGYTAPVNDDRAAQDRCRGGNAQGVTVRARRARR